MFGVPCWPFRWLHRRARRADIAVMWPQLVQAGYAKHAARGALYADAQIRRAWLLFTRQPGQEHWRCPCSDEHTMSAYNGPATLR